jgi:hypothetical protein
LAVFHGGVRRGKAHNIFMCYHWFPIVLLFFPIGSTVWTFYSVKLGCLSLVWWQGLKIRRDMGRIVRCINSYNSLFVF